MNKFWIILAHTYMTRLKTKSFYISTAIILLFIVGMANFQTIVDTFSGEDKNQIAVIDESGELFEALQANVSSTNDDIELVAVEESEENVKEDVQDDVYQALMVLEINEEQLPEATYYSNNITESSTLTVLEQQLQQVKVALATTAAGIDQETITDIYSPVTFQKIALDESAKTDEELSQARGIVYVMLFVLYIAVLMYGTMIATDVATEKSSRVMEILVSSASPVTHMFAKISGIALLGLTQIILFVVVGYSVIQAKQEELTGGIFEYFGLQDTSLSVYIYGVIFFLLGYLLYATLAAMLGSLVSRVEDVNQLITPMTLLVVAAFLLAMFGLNMPESTIVTVTSFIPFFTPMLMFLRVGMLDIAFWEVAISLGLLIGTIIILALIGARVYKGGVLMYGRSSSLKDMKKAIELTKKEK
ncbi:ABC-2 type transport system permease protein [Oceanobacillus limi]|uniref:ABC-2 type transport system permease protein n=1 Tax=Oceanobacillus limi TaxID=930131 RepID=A0A1H9YK18_9BACI|nr:ABC transporter permease [Oceanobacillus limi]SES69415.1 ABC-2 type transport system permease protein [Oceanobacillus limi]